MVGYGKFKKGEKPRSGLPEDTSCTIENKKTSIPQSGNLKNFGSSKRSNNRRRVADQTEFPANQNSTDATKDESTKNESAPAVSPSSQVPPSKGIMNRSYQDHNAGGGNKRRGYGFKDASGGNRGEMGAPAVNRSEGSKVSMNYRKVNKSGNNQEIASEGDRNSLDNPVQHANKAKVDGTQAKTADSVPPTLQQHSTNRASQTVSTQHAHKAAQTLNTMANDSAIGNPIETQVKTQPDKLESQKTPPSEVSVKIPNPVQSASNRYSEQVCSTDNVPGYQNQVRKKAANPTKESAVSSAADRFKALTLNDNSQDYHSLRLSNLASQRNKKLGSFVNSNSYAGSSSSMGRGKLSQNNAAPAEAATWMRRDSRHITENEYEVFGSGEKSTIGINFDSYDNIPVEIHGHDSEKIKPLDSFDSFADISPALANNVKRLSFSKPTPIQKHSYSIIRERRDLMACAQTGSGKTAAFLLPILSLMIQEGPPPTPQLVSNSGRMGMHRMRNNVYPVGLILAPTRELALQIYKEACKFQFGTGIRSVALYGGGEVRAQCMELEKGCDICVATPGRLNDLIMRNRVSVRLVKYLVLDEADRMLDMGFAPQIKDIVERSDMPSPDENRLTVMFSATFPKCIQDLAGEYLKNFIYLAVGRVGSTNESIKQRLLYADDDQKLRYLTNILNEQDKGLVMIFVETKRKADLIESYLLDNDFQAVSIHGDRTQQEREEALKLFKTGTCPLLVATDVAARGLDINNVTHVINFDLPSNIDDYVHRIGRTGRAGHLGLATSFVNPKCRSIFKDLLNVLEECHQEIPGWFNSLVIESTSGMRRSGLNSMGASKSGNMASRSKHDDNAYRSKRVGGYGRFDHDFPEPQAATRSRAAHDQNHSVGFNDAW